MGRAFGGIGGAKIGQGGVYFLPGKYRVELAKVALINSRKREDMFVVETTIQESDVPERKPGTKCSYICNMKNDSALGNIKAFLAACAGADPDNEKEVEAAFTDKNGQDITEETAEMAVSDENPLAGTVLDLVCVNKQTRGSPGNPPHDFTLHFWKPVKE